MTAKLGFTKEQVLEAYSGNASIGLAAKRLGCGKSALTKLMREYGIESKPRGARPGQWRSRVPRLNDREWLTEQIVARGRTQQSIAEELGTSSGNVAHYVRKHNLYPQVSQSVAMRAWMARRYPNGRCGPDSPRWKGGRYPTGSGYMRIWKPDHPNATPKGYVYEHRLVMEEKIGRYLRPGEVVDHIDCNRGNNAPENLRLHATRSDHVKDHFRGRLEMKERVDKLEAEIAELRKRLPEDR